MRLFTMALFKVKEKGVHEYSDVYITSRLGGRRQNGVHIAEANGKFAVIWRVNLHAILGIGRNNMSV